MHTKQIENTLKSINEHDLLTGFYNRGYFENLVSDKISNRQNKSEKIAILFLDIDSFKSINIAVGYEGGDFVLKKISERIINILYPTTLISRMEGDKFVIVTFEASIEEIDSLILRINGVFISPFLFEDNQFTLTVSIGICIFPDDGSSVSVLFKNAEIAMKESKETCQNSFKFYNPKMSEQATKRVKFEQHLSSAIQRI
jgi:diguanylate cyclase (GGDEF)-like protein